MMGIPYELSEQWRVNGSIIIIYGQEFHDIDLFFEFRTHLTRDSSIDVRSFRMPKKCQKSRKWMQFEIAVK